MIEKTFGCTRYIYNNFLAERKNKYEESKTRISVYEQLKELTDLKKEKELITIYESKYGPMTLNSPVQTNIWLWNNSPWPWEVQK